MCSSKEATYSTLTKMREKCIRPEDISYMKNGGTIGMEDKIVIITGANSGIGKAATLKFATEGFM